MAKGRNTVVIAIRIPDSVYAIIKRRAAKRGLSVTDWLKKVVIYDQHIASVNTKEGDL